MKIRFLQYIFISIIIFAITGCRDDFMYNETIGEGKASISATVDFKPMGSSLGRSRAAGSVLNNITSLYVLMYDYKTSSLIKSWNIVNYSETDETRTDEDAENGHKAEQTTKRATFNLPERVDYGRYYMYAVANMPDLLTNSKYSTAIQTVDGLKNIPLAWDSENMSNNGQMIGCLMTRVSTLPIDDEPLVLDENTVKLHAWLRRAASKVTVAFDGSRLKDGVSIYIKSLRIKNIPRTCLLGAVNTVGKKGDDDKPVKDANNLIETGEEVVYSTSMSYDKNYPALITKDLPCYPRIQETGDDGTLSWVLDPDVHSENAPNSLFFYENMQGEGPDKTQYDTNGDGGLDELYAYGDMPNATYIEVDAYYESKASERPGICNITYRFMLGQNIKTDYNASRNCHYKLTLFFNGYADDPDWRIDYVTRIWATDPEVVDYRGKYFVPDNESSNQGNNFSGDNYITVTSFMYENDDWFKRKPQPYKIEYRDAGSDGFKSTPPEWFSLSEPTVDGEGKYIHKFKINYTNPCNSVNINDKLLNNPQKAGIYDLATKGGSESMNTANSYVVDSKGTYLFPLVYGNAITNGVTNEDSYTYRSSGSGEQFLKKFLNYQNKEIASPYILTDISPYGKQPSSVSLLWQDEPNLITDIRYESSAYGGKGGIRFTVGNGIKEGNAVIVLKDQNGTIIWSWHIWVTAVDLTRTIMLTNADVNETYGGSRKFEIMPVNLGWCSGGISVRYYDRHECEVRFTQLISGEGQKGVSKTVKVIQEPHIAIPVGNNPYYQWGRKDPFVAAGDKDKTTKTWYDASGTTRTSDPAQMYNDDLSRVETYKATAALIQNPDKWQNGPRVENPKGSAQPYKPNDKIFFNLWNNMCWNDVADFIKTVYDPCPAGFHVSWVYTFTGFTDTGKSQMTDVDKGKEGDIRYFMYAATEENMMPNDWEGYKKYNDNIVEFYADRSKLISIGFPANGYRDWDDNAKVWQFGQGEVWTADAYSWIGTENAYHLEFTRLSTGFTPHIYPWNNFYATDGMPVRPTR